MTPLNNQEHLYGRVAVFIDAANIIHCYKDTQWKITNDDGTITLKGNCDTDIVVDAVSRMKDYDTVVIMSGDSDFVSLVHLLKGNGKKVIIVSTRWHVAKDLIQAADFYVDINKFKKDWELIEV